MVRFPTIARARWSAVVTALRELGFGAIDLPLVWREHERAPGVFDFETGPRDLATMIATIRDAGLDLVVRVGPMVTDDAPGLCLPERIFTDRRMLARTRRQNPVLVPDPPRMIPLPSIASQAFREEATRWVRAACDAVAAAANGHVPVRIIVGDGPHGLVRDDPFEADHHPEARGELSPVEPPHDVASEAADAEVKRESLHAVTYRRALVEAVRASALANVPIVVAVHGAATISPAAHELAKDFAIALPSPPPTAGTMATWRQVRHAMALTAKHGVHFDLWSGGPAWYPPMRGSHTIAAARLALAAGARDVTVRMGCAGERWIGAVISDTAQSRPHAPMWTELLAWAGTLPTGEERAVSLVESREAVERARAATGVHPLPLGLLALVGLNPAQLAVAAAPSTAEKSTLGDLETRLTDLEQNLAEAGIPFRRVANAVDELATDTKDGIDELTRRARDAFGHLALPSEPPGAVLVRAVDHGDHDTVLVAVSKIDRIAKLHFDGVATRALDGEAIDGPITVLPGTVHQFIRTRPSAQPAETRRSSRAPAPAKKSVKPPADTKRSASRKSKVSK